MESDRDCVISSYESAARMFVHIVDSAAQHSSVEFLADIEGSLVELYRAPLGIPAVKPISLDIDESPPPANEGTALFEDMRTKLGQLDSYWTMFDATLRESPVQGSLANDICDIYSDLKSGLQNLGRHGSSDDVIWGLRNDFLSHWGRHLTNALKAIRDLKLR